MQIRTGTTGVFLGCSGYALDPKERCKTTINLISGDEIADDDDAEVRQLRAKHRCKKCNTAMDGYLIDETRKLHVCGNNPDCDGYEIEPSCSSPFQTECYFEALESTVFAGVRRPEATTTTTFTLLLQSLLSHAQWPRDASAD